MDDDDLTAAIRGIPVIVTLLSDSGHSRMEMIIAHPEGQSEENGDQPRSEESVAIHNLIRDVEDRWRDRIRNMSLQRRQGVQYAVCCRCVVCIGYMADIVQASINPSDAWPTLVPGGASMGTTAAASWRVATCKGMLNRIFGAEPA